MERIRGQRQNPPTKKPPQNKAPRSARTANYFQMLLARFVSLRITLYFVACVFMMWIWTEFKFYY